MTAATFQWQMDRMSGLKFAPSDLTTHWEGLRDLPDDILSAAVSHAQLACIDFPTPRELREFADLVKPHVAPLAPEEDREGPPLATPLVLVFPGTALTNVKTVIRGDREWSYYCDECSDTGRRSIWCADTPSKAQPWMPARRCGARNCERFKRADGYDHEWVEPCSCVDWNPWLKRKKDEAVKYAAERSAKT